MRALSFLSAAAFLAAAGSAVPAYALTDTNFTYSAFQAGYVEISPIMLTAQTGADTDAVHARDNQLGLTSASGCYVAQVQIPNGAWLASIDVYYATIHTGSSFYAELTRHQFSNVGLDRIVSQYIKDTTNTRKKITYTISNANHRLVRTDLYAYGFGICLHGGDRFYGARLNYHFNSAGE